MEVQSWWMPRKRLAELGTATHNVFVHWTMALHSAAPWNCQTPSACARRPWRPIP